MKKNFYLLFVLAVANIQLLSGQVNIVVLPDSVFKEEYITEPEIALPSHITNNSGDTVTIRWTRVLEQEPQGWDYAFCDKNLCYLGTVSSKTFELINGEVGLLKPIFYPNEIAGVGVMRVYLTSETPGVIWADTAVFVAEAIELVGVVEGDLVQDLAVFPSPASDYLNVVFAEANFSGTIQIIDAFGQVALMKTNVLSMDKISIGTLPAGIYVLSVRSEKGELVATKPFVKA